MAQTRVRRSYLSRAEQAVEWDAILRIFDTIWGRQNRSLPTYPESLKNMRGIWKDGGGVEHSAESLDEIGQAYQKGEAEFIYISSFGRSIPFRASFRYWPRRAEVDVEVEVSDQATAEQGIAAVKQEFPLIAKYVFISYSTKECNLALYIKKILDARLVPGVEAFVAERDIPPGAHPSKVMLEEQLLRAEALVALYSRQSKKSPWLWWESSAVWARGHLVIPLFIDITSVKFDDPLTLLCQGRTFFDVAGINSTLRAVIGKVCLGRQCEELRASEIDELNMLRETIQPSGNE